MKDIIQDELKAHIEAAKLLNNLYEEISLCADACINCLKKQGKIILLGNGGSAADAQHIAAELVGRYKTNRKGLSAIALTTDTSTLTAIGNDFGFEKVFERQIEAIANKGDVVIGISTSGKSINVNNALNLASKLECMTIGLTGKDGGKLNKICNLNIVAPSNDTPRIQEMHIIIGHIICHLVDLHFQTK